MCSSDLRENKLVLFTDTVLEDHNYRIKPLISTQTDSSLYDLCITHAIYGYSLLPKAREYIHIFHGTILGNLFVRPWLSIHPSFLRWLLMEKRSTLGKSGIVGVSFQACKEIKTMGFKGPIKKIPSGGGFESDRYMKAAKADNLTIVFCGRTQDKVKRFPWILKGFAIARRYCQGIELRVIGPGYEGMSMQGVYFMGDLQANEVGSELAKAHIQINASHYEGSSLALAEGVLQGGLISLVTPVGGNRDIIENGVTGYFFESPHELASLIRQLEADRGLCDLLLDNVQRLKFQWTWEHVAKEVLDFGRDLIKARQ